MASVTFLEASAAASWKVRAGVVNFHQSFVGELIGFRTAQQKRGFSLSAVQQPLSPGLRRNARVFAAASPLPGKIDVLEQLGIERLGSKERKELRAYAHGLGTKLNVQHVGKLGVSQTVIKSISDALEANEILKVKVLENCGSDMSEIVTQLESGTRGQMVGKIGRTVLLYRASQRKLTAAEKRPEKTRPRRK